ncbi:hypothetical protein H311_02099 [Anncaliia algerae PRA109]|nr:hypothetical protein H311_02099 [Anncaliia algerae PRA109]
MLGIHLFFLIVAILILLILITMFIKLFNDRRILKEITRETISECTKVLDLNNLIDDRCKSLNYLLCRHILNEDTTNLNVLNQLISKSPVHGVSNIIGSTLLKLIERIKEEQTNKSGLGIDVETNIFPNYIIDNPILESCFFTLKLNSLKKLSLRKCYYAIFPVFSFHINLKESLHRMVNNLKYDFDENFGGRWIMYPAKLIMIFDNSVNIFYDDLIKEKRLIIDNGKIYKLKFIGVNFHKSCKIYDIRRNFIENKKYRLGLVVYKLINETVMNK